MASALSIARVIVNAQRRLVPYCLLRYRHSGPHSSKDREWDEVTLSIYSLCLSVSCPIPSREERKPIPRGGFQTGSRAPFFLLGYRPTTFAAPPPMRRTGSDERTESMSVRADSESPNFWYQSSRSSSLSIAISQASGAAVFYWCVGSTPNL